MNSQEDIKLLIDEADKGSVNAQLALGEAYEYGRGVPQNGKKAVHWYGEAARRGDVKARRSLGFIYKDGKGVAQDYEEAFSCFRQAARVGDVVAQVQLGHMYQYGEGVAQNYGKAVKCFEAAAEQDYANAYYALGWMYMYGSGVQRSHEKAFGYFSMAVTKREEYPEAQDILGRMYEEGQFVTQNYGKAFKWYKKAAEGGIPHAQSKLGEMYLNGWGVRQDMELGEMWLSKFVAQTGSNQAPIVRYEQAKNLTQRPQYLRDAVKGPASMQHELGMIYMSGEATPQDYTQAYAWFDLAAKQGDEASKIMKMLLEKELFSTAINRARALAEQWREHGWHEQKMPRWKEFIFFNKANRYMNR